MFSQNISNFLEVTFTSFLSSVHVTYLSEALLYLQIILHFPS